MDNGKMPIQPTSNNNQSSTVNPHAEIFENESIDLGKIFKNIACWVSNHYRGMCLTLVIMSAFVVLTAVGLAIKAPPLVTYSATVSLKFPQSDKGTYPSGAPFSVNDIIARKVLEDVWSKNDLQNQGVSLVHFINSVSVVQYSPNEEFIRTKYRSMLARKGLSQTDISNIERDFSDEMNASSKQHALLTITTPFNSALSGGLAKKILTDIPKTWSEISIRDLGVTAIPIADSENINPEITRRGSAFQVVDYFYKSASDLEKALTKISTFPGGETLRDPQTNQSIEDLKKKLSDLIRYWILDFDNYSQEHIKPTEVETLSAEIRYKELITKKKEYQSKAETYRNALIDYDALKQQESRPSTLVNGREGQNSLQLQGDAIQRLINLGSQNKDAEFRQELTMKRVQEEIQANSLDAEISRLSRRIESARRSVAKSNANPDRIKSYTAEIVTQLENLGNSVSRIQKVQMSRFMDSSGVLYSISPIRTESASSLARWFGVPFGLLLVLGSLGLAISALRRFSSHR